PIGLLSFSLVADVAFRAGWNGPPWPDLAFYTMFGGVIGALLAALPGFVDYLAIVRAMPPTPTSDTATIATAHMGLNLLAVALYAANLYLRSVMPPTAALPLLLSVMGIGILVASGWLGGVMVYEQRVAVTEVPADVEEAEVVVRRGPPDSR